MVIPTPLSTLKEKWSHKWKQTFHIWVPWKSWVYIIGPTNLLAIILSISPRTSPTDSSKEDCFFRYMLIKDDSKEENILIFLTAYSCEVMQKSYINFTKTVIFFESSLCTSFRIKQLILTKCNGFVRTDSDKSRFKTAFNDLLQSNLQCEGFSYS